MGRKAKEKKRKELTSRTKKWLAALLVRLQEEDLQKLTMDDIAKLAGKSKSTIYEYFEYKEDVLRAACQTRIDFLSEQIIAKAPKEGSSIAMYKYYMEVFTEGISDISVSFLQNIKLYYPTAWEAIDAFTDSFVSLIKALYQKGMEEGHFTPISIDLLSHLDKYFVTQVVTNQALFPDENYSLSRLVKDYLKLRLKGLVKAK